MCTQKTEISHINKDIFITSKSIESSMSASLSSNNSADVSFGCSENDSSVTESSLECENSFHAIPLTASVPTNICSEPRTTTNIGSIALQQCNQVTFGNQNFYQGSITIVCDNKNFKTETDGVNDRYCSRVREYFDRNWLSKRQKRVIIALISSILLATTTVILFRVMITTNEKYTVTESESNLGIATNPNETLKIVTRGEWLARPPSASPTYLEMPAIKVIIAHTATRNCTTEESCANYVRSCQNYHMDEKEYDDIGYNFLVGGDGNVFEGCGWDRQGHHTKGHNQRSICITFIGTFTKMQPPMRQLIVAEKLIDQGVKLKKIASDYRLFGHRQLIATESPGRELYKIIVKWPHWSEDIFT